MSKQCQICKTINHSAANHCTNCGNALSDKELSEEDKLRIELFEAKETIQGLNRALAEMHKNGNSLEEAQSTIADYKAKLTKEKQGNNIYAKQISEKDSKINLVSKQLDATKNSRTTWIVVLLILIFILGISAISLNQELDNKRYSNSSLEAKSSSLQDENGFLEQKISSLERDKEALDEKLNSISTYCPIIVNILKVGNGYKDGTIETDFGNTLYSFNSMYLIPQIEFIGLKNTTITVYLKLYKDGALRQLASPPSGYSFDSEINISENGISTLSGLGSETKGYWSAGNYRYEVWYNDMCLKAINFTLY